MKVGDLYFTWEYTPVTTMWTRCSVWAVDGIKGKVLLATGIAKQSEHDNHDRDKARKVSLTKALQIFHDKDFRASVWETYRTLTKKPRWSPKSKNRKLVIPKLA